MALISCFTTSSKVWQSQLWRMVIQGGASATSSPCSTSTSGAVAGGGSPWLTP